jgi:hypothetical protein
MPMRFFEKQRPEVYIHTARLKRDKKSGQRLWQFTLIVTMTIEQVQACDVPIAKAWEYITDRDSAAVDVLLASEVEGCQIEFFAQIDDATPVLHLEGVDLVGLRFTRDKNTVEFWFSGEHVNEGGIHDFMKPYAYTRVWAAFTPSQGDLCPIGQTSPDGNPAQIPQNKEELKAAVLPALDQMTAPIREGGIESMSLQIPGQEPVVIDRAGAERIHAAATKQSQRKSRKDPG